MLTLAHSLAHTTIPSKYPLVTLYTDTLPQECGDALDARGIPRVRVEYLAPRASRDYSGTDPRFDDTWSKLGVFGLTRFERVVLLDADMLVLRNMDELMDLRLDGDGDGEGDEGKRVFAACYACLCNPLGKGHYPSDW